MSWSISAALLALLLSATLPPHARVPVVGAGLVENWLPFLSCSEDSPFLFAQLPWDCSYYVMCAGADMTFHVCPPGMVFSQRTLVCDWPTLRDVRRCFGNINGYARATCRRHTSLRVPSPESCAMFLDCNEGTWPDMTQGQVFECPYPGLFSPVTRSCADFRQVEHLCGGRRVPRAPCEYVQYRLITPSEFLCNRRHPSCVGMRDGFHPAALSPRHTLYAKRCFRQRTVDVISCPQRADNQHLPKQNGSCTRHIYNSF